MRAGESRGGAKTKRQFWVPGYRALVRRWKPAACSPPSPARKSPLSHHSCLPLLLPAVEAGLSHEAWRIRQASVELCGELLFKVCVCASTARDLCGHSHADARRAVGAGSALVAAASPLHKWLHPATQVAGTSGKVKLDGGSDDEGAASEAHGHAILEALGRQRRDEVCGALQRAVMQAADGAPAYTCARAAGSSGTRSRPSVDSLAVLLRHCPRYSPSCT